MQFDTNKIEQNIKIEQNLTYKILFNTIKCNKTIEYNTTNNSKI